MSQEPADPQDKRAQEQAKSCDKRRTSGDQPARRDQQQSCETGQEPAVPRDKRARTDQSSAEMSKERA
jgi:hypothetical protein